jgi:hypothetical protein
MNMFPDETFYLFILWGGLALVHIAGELLYWMWCNRDSKDTFFGK